MPDSAELLTPGSRAALPTSLRVAVVILALEALALTAVAVYLGYEAVTGEPVSLRGALMVITYTALMAVVAGALCRALARRRSGARGPAVVLQILLVPLGGYLLSGGWYWTGVPTTLAGLCGVAALLARGTREALDDPAGGSR